MAPTSSQNNIKTESYYEHVNRLIFWPERMWVVERDKYFSPDGTIQSNQYTVSSPHVHADDNTPWIRPVLQLSAVLITVQNFNWASEKVQFFMLDTTGRTFPKVCTVLYPRRWKFSNHSCDNPKMYAHLVFQKFCLYYMHLLYSNLICEQRQNSVSDTLIVLY
jgi:hypothetical protein